MTPAGSGGDCLPVPDRDCVAGLAGRVRALADSVEAAPPVQRGRHLGRDPGRAGRSRRRGRRTGLDRQRGLHDQPGSPARRHPAAGHRGHRGITRICAPSRLTTRSAAPAAGCRPRSTTCATGRAARSCCCSDPGRRGLADVPAPAGRGQGAPGRAGSAPHHTGRGDRRQGLLLPRQPGPAACSRHPRRDLRTVRPGGASPRQGFGHQDSTPTPTSAATSSSVPSTPSNSGAAWPLATTSSPSPTAAGSSSPPSSSGYAL